MDDDSGFIDWSDAAESESDATARGIVQCLHMLVEEAAALGMAKTLEALQIAIGVCTAEGDAVEADREGGDIRLHVAGSSSLH